MKAKKPPEGGFFVAAECQHALHKWQKSARRRIVWVFAALKNQGQQDDDGDWNAQHPQQD